MKTLKIFVSTILLLTVGLLEKSRSEVYNFGSALNLTGSGFGPYIGSDSPFYAYNGVINAGTQYVDVTMSVNLTTVGPHQFFLYFINYDFPDFISLPAYSTNSIKLDYRNTYSGKWSKALTFTNAAPLSSIVMRFDRTNSLSTTARLLIMGLFITTNMISTLDRDGYLIDWTYPVTMDTNAPVAGNIVHDSSFEGRGNEGWGISKQSRTNFFIGNYETNLAYHGTTSLKLPIDITATYISRLYKVSTNKQHTVSAYVRAVDGTATAEIGFQNAKTPPTGLGLSNQQWAAVSATVGTNWTRISTNFYALKYPESEFRVTMRGTAGTASGVLFDAIQVEEGSLTSYAPQSDFEIGLVTDVDGNIFTNAESASIIINAFNHGSNSVTQRVDWRITDNMQRVLRSGYTNISLTASNRTSVSIKHDLSRTGWFLFDAWVPGLNGSGDELQYAVNFDEYKISTFGGHVEGTFQRNPNIISRLGADWTRGLSMFNAGRWSVAEPTTPGTFVWQDTEVARIKAAGLKLMQNIGENIPPWAVRTYFTLTNVSGPGFTLGETITSGSKTGQVAWILYPTNYTGNALQLTNAGGGTFSSNDTITGSSSGTTATVFCNQITGTPDLFRWRLYVSNWVSHYMTNVPSIEIWNEPNQDGDIPKPNGSLAFYAEIVREAVYQIKAICPTTEIVALGGLLTTNEVNSIMSYFDTNILAKIDRISMHLYDYNAAGAWGIFTGSGYWGKPIDNTETGIYDKGSYLGANSPRKTEGYPVSLWNELEWRVKTAVDAPFNSSRNVIMTHSGRLERYFYYDFRYSSHMPETAGAPSQPSAMDYDDCIIAKGVSIASTLRMLRGYTGFGPITTKNTNVWAYCWEGTNGSAAAIWSTNNSPYTLALTNGYASSKVTDFFGVPLYIGISNFPAVRTPRFIFTDAPLSVLSNAVKNANVTLATDTDPPVARITLCPVGKLPSGIREISIRWMGTDNQAMPTEGTPDVLRFQWRLLPIEESWIPADAAIYTVYRNLADGQYTFQVRAVDSSGNLSPVDSRAFSVGDSFDGKPRVRGTSASGTTFRLARP